MNFQEIFCKEAVLLFAFIPMLMCVLLVARDGLSKNLKVVWGVKERLAQPHIMLQDLLLYKKQFSNAGRVLRLIHQK